MGFDEVSYEDLRADSLGLGVGGSGLDKGF